MTDLSLRDDLVRRLEQIANRENRRMDEVIETLLNRYAAEAAPIDELRQDRLRMYHRARTYWQRLDDPRQNLTDEDLDQQFWLFDPDGIPRLKDEQSNIQLPADPLLQMLEMAESDPTVQWQATSGTESTKDILNREYTDHLLTRLNGTTASDE